MFQSRTDANGKPIGENGSYHLGDGSIHIDLNAGNLGQGVMVYTIAHEFTHFMEQQSPAKFQAFTDALFAELDTDAEEEIERKAKELKRQRPEQYRNASRDTLLEDARSEVVAEACENMLTDTDAAQRIGQSLKAKDATLFEKVKQWFRDLADKIRKAYKGLHPDSEIAQYAKKTIQQVDGLVQMWADMAVDAAENYSRTSGEDVVENAVDDSGKKYQARRLNAGDISEYLTAGNRKNQNKISAWNAGQKLILTSENEITEFIDNAIDRRLESNHTVAYGKVNERLAQEVFNVSNGKIKINDNFLELIPDNLQHAYEQHSIAKQDGDIDLGRTDFERIPEYLDSYTEVVYAIKYSSGKVGVCVSKKLPNGRILLIETVSKSRGALQFKNAIGVSEEKYKTDYVDVYKKGAGTNTGGSKSPNNSPHDESNSINSIRNPKPVVNQKNSERNSESGIGKYSNRDSAYIDAIKRGDMDTAKKMVEQAAKDSGYTRLFYHGSKKGGGFKIFRDWQYFTENKEYAKRYTDRGNAESLYTTYVKMDNPFDTRIAEVRKLFRDARMEYGMGELQENGLPDWTDGYDIADFIDENDLPYDSIVLDEGGDMVDGKPVSRGLSYVIRKSNQIKSADIITYDDSGNVIPLSQRFNTQNNDIRYSNRNQDQQAALEKQNGKLREDVERMRELLKLQGKTTGGKLFKPDPSKPPPISSCGRQEEVLTLTERRNSQAFSQRRTRPSLTRTLPMTILSGSARTLLSGWTRTARPRMPWTNTRAVFYPR